MSLVRFSHTDEPLRDLANKIRHTYDLHLLLQVEEIQTFFESTDFDVLLKTVAHDDVASYRIKLEWLAIHPAEALIFRDIDGVWEKLKDTYARQFRYLVFGRLPDEQDVYGSLTKIKARLKEIDWDVKLDGEN